MDIVLGGGISGLILAKRTNSMVLELQPVIGGLFANDNIIDFDLPLVPPIVDNIEFFKQLYDVKYTTFIPNILAEKEQYLKDKICSECDKLPQWLEFKKGFWIYNIHEYINNISKDIHVLHEYPISILKNKIITNKGKVINFDRIISTIPRTYLDKLLGIKENISSKSLFLAIIITENTQNDWNVYINGHSGVNISFVIRKEIKNNIYVNYVYAFFSGKLPDNKKIFSELKRLKIIPLDSILAFRTHVIRDAILYGETKDNGIISCGRLGLWKNLTLEESIDLAHKLQI
ncbi:hypothetical protein DFR86_07245 [Acidianus sulfidivorans JP7]|uniref:NAD(P)/FAD-dependent oxidoreductase n=1 Tax=Acidianus sulfidivorans JP7 TaxID=619593 RepID=A0A2U9IMW3_9CREN|nr:hypothetical protein [Acidianus sulfidivorans]AWR97363.1 hypothetical protein DFR86_07245 [Acidianus sulfidivorans JP7]